jgi:hypothetical protein
MRLTELNPLFLGDSERTIGVGVLFDCPCGNADEEHRCYVPFANPIGPGPLKTQQGWQRTGESFETLTLAPSIWRHPDRGGCGWHGFIRNGEVSKA